MSFNFSNNEIDCFAQTFNLDKSWFFVGGRAISVCTMEKFKVAQEG